MPKAAYVPLHIEPKAPTAVNKALAAAVVSNCGEMPQPGQVAGVSARFGPLDSPRRKFFGPWFRIDKRNRIVPTSCSQMYRRSQVRGLTKRFDRPAVDALDLTVRTGEFYALLGPNGAGKTTTLRMVAGLLRPDAGSVSMFGIDALADPVAAKQIMAWVSDEPMIYDKLTPLEYLEFVAGLWGIDPAVSSASRAAASGVARARAASARALRGIFQGHAPEGGAGRRAGARSRG